MTQGDDEEDTSSWKAPDRALRTDGRMTGDLPATSSEPPPPEAPQTSRDGLPTLDALTTGELVLARPKPSPPAYIEPGPYRDALGARRPWGLVLGLMALGVGVLVLFVLRPGLQHQLALPAAKPGTLMIFSDPVGATVKIGDSVVGVTPFGTDNVWGGEVKYELSAPGRQSKRGTFKGGADVELNLSLPKQKQK